MYDVMDAYVSIGGVDEEEEKQKVNKD